MGLAELHLDTGRLEFDERACENHGLPYPQNVEVATASESFPWPGLWSLLFPHVTVAAKASMASSPGSQSLNERYEVTLDMP